MSEWVWGRGQDRNNLTRKIWGLLSDIKVSPPLSLYWSIEEYICFIIILQIPLQTTFSTYLTYLPTYLGKQTPPLSSTPSHPSITK